MRQLTKRIVWIITSSLLIVTSFLLIATSYFHTKEIDLLSTQCYENEGIVSLEIHNQLTSAYSFSCD